MGVILVVEYAYSVDFMKCGFEVTFS